VTRYPEGPAASPGFLLWHLTLAWQRAVTAVLEPLDLTHVQFVLLATSPSTNSPSLATTLAAWMSRSGEKTTFMSPGQIVCVRDPLLSIQVQPAMESPRSCPV
jgi:hypothetical protein